MDLAYDGNMDGIKAAMCTDRYTVERGLMAISVAQKKGNDAIVYEMLSPPGAWEYYVTSQFSPFVVLDEMEKKVMEYRRCICYQTQTH